MTSQQARAPDQGVSVPKQIPWSRVFVEGAVIVASILLAFAIEAGWQSSRERQATREMLTAVQAELLANREGLVSATQKYRDNAAAAALLLTLTGPSPDQAAISAAAEPIGTLMKPDLLRLQDASIDMLIASGQLAQIGDAQLRGAIGDWRETLSGLEATRLDAREAWLGRAWPLVLQHVPQLELEHASGFAGSPTMRSEFLDVVPPSSGFDSDYVGLLGHMQFESAIVQNLTLSIITADLIEGSVLPEAGALLALVDQRLAGG